MGAGWLNEGIGGLRQVTFNMTFFFSAGLLTSFWYFAVMGTGWLDRNHVSSLLLPWWTWRLHVCMLTIWIVQASKPAPAVLYKGKLRKFLVYVWPTQFELPILSSSRSPSYCSQIIQPECDRCDPCQWQVGTSGQTELWHGTYVQF